MLVNYLKMNHILNALKPWILSKRLELLEGYTLLSGQSLNGSSEVRDDQISVGTTEIYCGACPA